MSAAPIPSEHTGHPTSSLRRARRRPGENKERLLEAGISVFGARGFHGASTAAIAELADVPQPHVYASFRTKHELFLACVRRAFDELSSASATSIHDYTQQKQSTCIHSDRDCRALNTALLLQALAAFHEQNLQPELGELLRKLRDAIGPERLASLITMHTRTLMEDL